jgi:hypothetical protein
VCDKREGGRNEKETYSTEKSLFFMKKKMRKRPPYSTKKCFSVFPLVEMEEAEEEQEGWHDVEGLEVDPPSLEDDRE